MGGLWSAFLDSAMGKSTLRLPEGASAWHVDTLQREATLIADLTGAEGSLGGRYAGISTRTPPGTHLSSEDLQGIGFSMRIPEGASLDSNKVAGVWFKVSRLSDSSSAPYYSFLPHDLFQNGKAEVCIDFRTLSQTEQPDVYVEAPAALFSPQEITSFSWILGIRDTSSSVPNQGVSIGPVTLYGVSSAPCDCPAEATNCTCPELVITGTAPQGVGPQRATASWRNGRLTLSGFEAASRVEIRTLEGRLVSDLPVRSESRVALPPGTYLVIGRGAGNPLVRHLVVTR
jgi:hypothetical protein